MAMHRRVFLGQLSRLLGLLTLTVMGACRSGSRQSSGGDESARGAESAKKPREETPTESPSFFTPVEARTVRAMLDRLLPGDDLLPSARQTGVLNYLDRQLALPHFRGLERMMRAGVEFVERTAVRDMKRSFHELDVSAQDAILQSFQTGAVGGIRFPQSRFFSQFHSFALEGYLSDPQHGGNFQKRAWLALGIDPSCHHMFERCH